MRNARTHIRDWFDRITARPNFKPAYLDWVNQPYLDLMADKGAEAWPRVSEIIAGL